MDKQGFIQLIKECAAEDRDIPDLRAKLKRSITTWPGWDDLTNREKFDVFRYLTDKFGPRED